MSCADGLAVPSLPHAAWNLKRKASIDRNQPYICGSVYYWFGCGKTRLLARDEDQNPMKIGIDARF